MKLLRLRAIDFAAIVKADVEFGAGLNVLYGPNDLGKSTLAQCIRAVLLLPHASSFSEQYVPWRGGHQPIVEMTFDTEAQRIWRVRKQFGKSGSSLLQESRNGVDFDDVAKGRSVDGRLREILRWGILEPGGSGAGKGIPTSFLATALLSTQSNVTAVLESDLQGDPAPSGKERIAAALQAVSQDPLFVSVLRATRARRDEAFTERGARKTARDSPFKIAAERLREIREERENLQALVDESEGVEQHLRELTLRRNAAEEAVVIAADRLRELERLAAESAALTAAAEEADRARNEVARIKKLATDVAAAESAAADLEVRKNQADQALDHVEKRKAEADAALQSALEAARAAGSDAETSATVAHQRLELRRAGAEKALGDAQRRAELVAAAQKAVDAAVSTEAARRAQETEEKRARTLLADATTARDAAERQQRALDVLERALEARVADEQVVAAQAAVDNAALLRANLDSAAADLEALRARRDSHAVPGAEAMPGMRRLATDLATAQGALDVGLFVTVTPRRPLEIRVQKDDQPPSTSSGAQAVEIEAGAHVEVDLGDLATVRVAGGRRDARRKAEALEETDLDELDMKIQEAREIDSRLQATQTALTSLQNQLEALSGSSDTLRVARDRQAACHAALEGAPFDKLSDELTRLGPDPKATLRTRREQANRTLETAREAVTKVGTAHALAEERGRMSAVAFEEALAARDAALLPFPDGLAAARKEAERALSDAAEEQRRVASELASLDSSIAAERARIETAVNNARKGVERAQAEVGAAQEAQKSAIAEHASQTGRLDQLRRLRDAEDLAAAEHRLRIATEQHASLPVPERPVTDADVTAGGLALARATSTLDATDDEIHRKHGALEQVGGAVARERLRDVIEAYELAERQEKEIEADYEAWKLLLEQMKEADAAQASNLGQVLAPAIAARFEALTAKRYENVRLTAQLATEGVVVAGAIRTTNCISVGTREQLSTLYRLSLAEYLGTAVVLDDQLVQSDGTRMDWFRALLAEKARSFQIVVFTCRPEDYLPDGAMVPPGTGVYRDTDDGFVRAVDLERAAQRR
jgi:hypothetical protein